MGNKYSVASCCPADHLLYIYAYCLKSASVKYIANKDAATFQAIQWLRPKQFTGLWACTSFEIFDSGNPESRTLIAKPHGEQPLARLVITKNGWISVHTANPLVSLPQRSLSAVNDEEAARIVKSLNMWCGRLNLQQDEDGLFWEASVEVAADPAKIGSKEARRTTFVTTEGTKEKMKFSTMEGFKLPDGTSAHAELTWERLETT